VPSRTHSDSPIADGQEVLEKERIPLDAVDGTEVRVECGRHFFVERFRFAVAQPHPAAFRADHKLLRLHTHTHTHTHVISRLQAVQNASARLFTGTRRRDHIIPVLRQLHWLPVHQCIKFKVPFSFTSRYMA